MPKSDDESNSVNLYSCDGCKSKYLGNLVFCVKCGSKLLLSAQPSDTGQPLLHLMETNTLKLPQATSPSLHDYLRRLPINLRQFENELTRLKGTKFLRSLDSGNGGLPSLHAYWLEDPVRAQRVAAGVVKNWFNGRANPRIWMEILAHECSLLTYGDTLAKYTPQRIGADLAANHKVKAKLDGKSLSEKLAALQVLYFEDYEVFQVVLSELAYEARDTATNFNPGVGEEVPIIYTPHPHY